MISLQVEMGHLMRKEVLMLICLCIGVPEWTETTADFNYFVSSWSLWEQLISWWQRLRWVALDFFSCINEWILSYKQNVVPFWMCNYEMYYQLYRFGMWEICVSCRMEYTSPAGHKFPMLLQIFALAAISFLNDAIIQQVQGEDNTWILGILLSISKQMITMDGRVSMTISNDLWQLGFSKCFEAWCVLDYS